MVIPPIVRRKAMRRRKRFILVAVAIVLALIAIQDNLYHNERLNIPDICCILKTKSSGLKRRIDATRSTRRATYRPGPRRMFFVTLGQ